MRIAIQVALLVLLALVAAVIVFAVNAPKTLDATTLPARKV